eukprot:gene8923-9660_t
MSSLSFFIPMVLLIVGCGFVLTGVSLLRKVDKNEMYKVTEEELSVMEDRFGSDVDLRADNIPNADSGLTTFGKNREMRKGDFLLASSINVGDHGEDGEKGKEEPDTINIVRDGVEAASSVKSAENVSMDSAGLFNMFSVTSFTLLQRNGSNSEEEDCNNDEDDLSLIFEFFEVGDKRIPSPSDRIHKIHSTRPYPSLEERVGDIVVTEEKSDSGEGEILSLHEFII